MEDMIAQPEVQRLLRPDALAAFLALHVPGDTAGAPLGAYRIRGGHSNETFFLWRGADLWVLRRPPLGVYLPTAHDVAREYRVLQAVQHTDVPVPRPILLCADENVIGAPFYLMAALDGVVLRNQTPEWAATPEHRHEIGIALIDTLATLHNVDWHSIGLADFGKPEGYLERQVRRWTDQRERARTRDIPDLDAVTQWLAAHIPPSPRSAIVHGDFRIDNAMYARGLPVRLIGLLDWEMSTIGDPLADLGYLLTFWREAGDPPSALASESAWLLTGEPGYPTRAELIARYAEQTGLSLTAQTMTFYQGLALWKMAILLEGSYKRYLAGVTDDPFFASLEQGVPALAASAKQIVIGG